MAIHKSLSKLISDKEFNHVVIGYSGGVDSSVLLYLISKNSITLVAVGPKTSCMPIGDPTDV